ncbi:tail fiber assembly protein [Pseudomonas promysalinigenes]|uniref:Tail fiber assembly protein n=1 Tax=Pseudomonas putida TaxID=303 RepID=A0A0N9MPT6_PSEPU|nr:tail fiber assembly protein [Pseudomonas promysalinigenes]ALG76550.1 tail fiber assembly protein [Pseudomonas putida]QXI32777.1 tail fiber assembly protein [Pseudomonas promysalinigenes]
MTDVTDNLVVAAARLNSVELQPWWLQRGVEPLLLCNVHRGTGEFLCVSEADPSPLEPGIWLIPAHSYQIDPPVLKAGVAALINRDNNGWEIVPDHRGATVYTTDTGEPRQWLALGDLPEGYTLQAPSTEFDTWEGEQWVPDEAAIAEAARVVAYRKQALATQYSTERIGTLQDAVDLEMASEAEVAALTAWKVYRVELSRMDITAKVPTADDWPISPNDEALAAWLTSQLT